MIPSNSNTNAILDGKIPTYPNNAAILSNERVSNQNNVSKNLWVSTPNNAWQKDTHIPKHPIPRVTHSLAIKLQAQEVIKVELIHISPPKKIYTTKQGHLPVVFKTKDYKVKFAQRCRFTLIGKMDNIIPKMYVIRKQLNLQI